MVIYSNDMSNFSLLVGLDHIELRWNKVVIISRRACDYAEIRNHIKLNLTMAPGISFTIDVTRCLLLLEMGFHYFLFRLLPSLITGNCKWHILWGVIIAE